MSVMRYVDRFQQFMRAGYRDARFTVSFFVGAAALAGGAGGGAGGSSTKVARASVPFTAATSVLLPTLDPGVQRVCARPFPSVITRVGLTLPNLVLNTTG